MSESVKDRDSFLEFVDKGMQLKELPLTSAPDWEDLTLSSPPDSIQLENMNCQRWAIFWALKALTEIDEEAILCAATQLNLPSTVGEKLPNLALFANSTAKDPGETQQLDVDDLRSLVLIICYLAKQHQELIRRAVALLEQLSEEKRELRQAALLSDYIDRFSKLYSEGRKHDFSESHDTLTHLALKLLMDLLFYSTPGSHRRLWSTLLERSKK